LLDKEVIYREDLVHVFGERPFDSKETEFKKNPSADVEIDIEEKS
jgi:hypothetical protein